MGLDMYAMVSMMQPESPVDFKPVDASELHGGLSGWLSGGGANAPDWPAKVLADAALIQKTRG